MIALKQGLKLAGGVKSQISGFRHPLLLYNIEGLSPVYLHKCFSNISIFRQDRRIDSGVDIEKSIKCNTLFNANYDQGNRLSWNYWNNLKKSNLHTSSPNNVYDRAENQRKEKREANILIAMTVTLVAILTYVYSKVDFDEYDRPSGRTNL